MLSSNIKIIPVTGPHIAGITKVMLLPKDWILNAAVIDFLTGTIKTPIEILEGYQPIELQFLAESYDYDEKPKINKAGSFYEISLSGLINDLDPLILQTLNTYRYHQFAAIIQDKQKRNKLVGDKFAGLIMQFRNSEKADKGGTQQVSIEFNMEMEYPAPFYLLDQAVQHPQLGNVLDLTAVYVLPCIELHWTAVENASWYVLDRSTSPDFSVDIYTVWNGEATTYTDCDISNGVTYYYRIIAQAPGYDNSNPAFAFCSTPGAEDLATPTDFVANFSNPCIETDWADVEHATLYILERAQDADFTNDLALIYQSSDSFYTDCNISEGSHYYYRVTATADGYGPSNPAYADAAWMIYLEEPDLVLDVLGNDSIAATWEAVTGATEYYLRRATNPAMTENAVTIYEGPDFSFTDTGLDPNTTYYYLLIAKDPGYLDSPPDFENATTTDVAPTPSITGIGGSDTGPGGTRTQIFEVGTNITTGQTFYVGVYSHQVIYIAVPGDTPASITAALVAAVNATTEAQWDDVGSAPAHGTNGFPPTASDDGAGQFSLTLNWQNSFAAGAY